MDTMKLRESNVNNIQCETAPKHPKSSKFSYHTKPMEMQQSKFTESSAVCEPIYKS